MIIINKMETFTDIYNKYIVGSLILFEIDRRNVDENIVSQRVELEFNEERGIEIELHLNKGDVLKMLHVFYMIVCDARFAYCNKDSENYEDFQDYMECKLGARKLSFLVGEDIYNKLMICNMDYKS